MRRTCDIAIKFKSVQTSLSNELLSATNLYASMLAGHCSVHQPNKLVGAKLGKYSFCL